MSGAIYLDGFATTPLAPEAKEAMVRAWSVTGNAASPHSSGARASAIIAEARTDVAALIGASASEIVFTSGATEANNLALLGVARALRSSGSQRRRLIVSAIEHKSVLEPAHALAKEGLELTIAPVDRCGRLDLEALPELLGEDTLLVSIMAVNNETGVVQPLTEAAALAHKAGALFHTDAAQAGGKVPLDVLTVEIDYLSLSAHKCYGPMGVGALYVAATAPAPAPLHFGGGQQGGLRPGTEPVALLAGFAAAARVAREQLEADGQHGRRLAAGLLAELRNMGLNAAPITGDHAVVPGSLAFLLEGVDAEDLCLKLSRDVQLSTGSACTSGQLRISHVFEAMGFSESQARQVMRVLCHRYLNDDDISAAARYIAAAVDQRSALAAGGVRQ